MTMSIAALIPSTGDTGYSSISFRRVIEDHLEWLRIHPLTTTIFPSVINAHKAKGDFYKLLALMNIPPDLWWIIMRVNGYVTPMDYLGDDDTGLTTYGNEPLGLLVPNESTLKTMLMRHNQFIGTV